jgi:hypothetical protein
MNDKTKHYRIGRYRVFYWPTGEAGWVVQSDKPEGGLGEILSKHETLLQAKVAAARYDNGDIRRGLVDVR